MAAALVLNIQLMGSSEEDLTESLEAAMEKYPDTYAVLVRRHGM